MARLVLTHDLWEQLKKILKDHGCRSWKNDRTVMEAILWKLRTGAPWHDVPKELCPWETAYNRFKRWANMGLWDDVFLNYEKTLIKNGHSSMEVKYGLISMRAEMGLASSAQLAALEEAFQQEFILPVTRMDIRLILKSLGVKFTTVKLQA